jgi:SNF2 family DNA or RNA helicase
MGLNNPTTLASRALYDLKGERRWAMSGTPMGGRPLKLYGALKFIEPQEYSSKWRWAETWLEVEEQTVRVRGGAARTVREIGGIQPGREDEFYAHHSRHMVRHLKSEVLPQLPPKQYVDVWCKMTPKQAKQYKQFADEAEVRIDEYNLTATGVLAEYARLKFFATAYCDVEGKIKRCGACSGSGVGYHGGECDACQGLGEVEKLKLKPTFDSGKLPYLMDKLSESGIDPKEPSGEAVAVVGSQSVEVCEMVHRYLNEQGIPTEILTGKTVKPGERSRLVKGFQNGEFRVLVVSTLAGGVAITLDRADTVHILDETWVPDDQAQLEDRIHRASRIHQVTCFYYRTRGSIEEYIYEVTQEKAWVNNDVLDLRRNGFRANQPKGAK